MPKFSSTFELTLHRALGYAMERRHGTATLEHFLLALIDDADARKALDFCEVDVERLRSPLFEYVDSELDTPLVDEGTNPNPSEGFQRSIQRAVKSINNQGRYEVTGADALLGILPEPASHAAYLLIEQGVTNRRMLMFIAENYPNVAATLKRSIGKSAKSAPAFVAHRGRIRFQQSPAKQGFPNAKRSRGSDAQTCKISALRAQMSNRS